MLRLLAVLSAPFALPLVAAPVPKHLFPKDPPLYFPTTVGTTWVYAEGNAEKTLVEAVEADRSVTVVTVAAVARGDSAPSEKVAVAPGSLVRLEFDGVKLDNPLVLLKAPPADGSKWASETDWGSRHPTSGVMTVAGTEVVTVPAGRSAAVRVDCAQTFDGRHIAASFWYAPGVGEVKLTVDGRVVRVLKSFTPGKD